MKLANAFSSTTIALTTKGTSKHSQALRLTNASCDIIFDRAPVMMHSLDRGNTIVKVNRRRLQRMGYKRSEVLGRKTVDFLTEGSRVSAVKTLPLFWRVGSARSIGYQFVKKNGQILEVLLDAEVSPTNTGLYSYAAIREGHGLTQLEQSSTTIRALQQLTRFRGTVESLLFPEKVGKSNTDLPGLQQSPGHVLEAGADKEVVGGLFELGQDISVNLRGLLRAQEEWLDATVAHQRELLLVAKNIERTLSELTDSLSTARPTPE